MNYFELFGLTPAVDIDVKALEQRHRELSLSVHPDRLTGADAHTRRKAAETTATLNDAVKTLRDPARRAAYLLKLAGIDLESERAAAQLQLPMDFLEETMARREALEEVKARRDVSAVADLRREAQAALEKALAEAFAALRRDDPPQAARALGQLRYHARFLEEVDAFEEELVT